MPQNTRQPTFVKETLLKLKSHIKPHTLIVGYFNTYQLWTGQTDREIGELTDVMTQMDLTNIYRTSHPNTNEYTFFSAPHGIFSKVDNILGNKEKSTDTKKKVGISPCILLDHHGLKLEFNNNTDCRKPTNSWKLNNAQMNHHWVKKERN